MASTPVFHMFWHGPELSRLERLCIQSFLAHGHVVHLHVYQEPRNTPAGVQLVDATQTLPQSALFQSGVSGSVAAFADWFRYRLLYERGGIWVDTDVVCLRPFNYSQSLLFARQDEHVINNAVLGLPAKHELARWMAECCEHPHRWLPYDSLKAKRRKLQRRIKHWNRRGAVDWGEYGPRGFTQAANHLGCASHALPFWHFYPIHYLNWHTVFDESLRDNEHMVAGSTALHLWNDMTRRVPGFNKNGSFPPQSLFEQLCRRYLKNDS